MFVLSVPAPALSPEPSVALYLKPTTPKKLSSIAALKFVIILKLWPASFDFLTFFWFLS